MFRKALEETKDKYIVAQNKYDSDNKDLQDEIEKCLDILKDEDKVKEKVKSLGLKYTTAKSKIPSLVNDQEFAEEWISMKNTSTKLKNLRKKVKKLVLNTKFNGQISLKSKCFNEETDLEPIENITYWDICYDGRNYLNNICIKYEYVKQLEEFGWIVELYTRKNKDIVDCGCYGGCECPETVSYSTIHTIILKLEEE